MKLFNNKTLALLFASLVFFSNTVFAIDLFGSDEDKIIWKVGKNVYLKYVDQGKSKSGKNDHPVELNEEEVRKALAALVVQQVEYSDTKVESTPVFSPLQVNLLGKHLLRGLIKAKPDQDIAFALQKSTDRLFGLKTTQLYVAGRAFYKNGKLNIILGDYDRARQEGYENAYDPTHMGIVAYNFDHGKRTKSSKKFKLPLVKAEGVELKERGRRDWFVMDTGVASRAYDLQVRNREKDELAGKRNELREILGEDAVSGTSAKERAKNSKERREMRAEMARMRKEMSEMSDGKASSAQSLEARLATLDQLKKKGLVSDKEYQKKRREIINDI